MWITTNYGKLLKRWGYQTTLPVSREAYILVKKQKLELDMEQWNGPKLGKEYIKAVYCHPACLTFMKSTSGFPGGSEGKESACNLGDVGSIPGSETDLLEKNMAIHCSILAWRILWTGEPAGCST